MIYLDAAAKRLGDARTYWRDPVNLEHLKNGLRKAGLGNY